MFLLDSALELELTSVKNVVRCLSTTQIINNVRSVTVALDRQELHEKGEIILFFPDGHKEHMPIGAPARGMVREGKKYNSYILRIIKQCNDSQLRDIDEWLAEVNIGLEELCP